MAGEYDVSVIVVTFNRSEEILARALKSVLLQTLPPDEIIVVDTGTDTDLSERKKNLSEKMSVCYVKCPETGGSYGRNLGASVSKSRYIAFLDDDDEWNPEKLSNQMAALDSGICIAYSDYLIENRGGTFDSFRSAYGTCENILSCNNIGCTSMILLSKKCFDEAGGFDVKFKSNQEWDLWIRILDKGKSTLTEGIAGVKHYDSGNISADRFKRKRGWLRLFGKHFVRYLKNPSSLVCASRYMYREMLSSKYYATAVFGFVLFLGAKVLSAVTRK